MARLGRRPGGTPAYGSTKPWLSVDAAQHDGDRLTLALLRCRGPSAGDSECDRFHRRFCAGADVKAVRRPQRKREPTQLMEPPDQSPRTARRNSGVASAARWMSAL